MHKDTHTRTVRRNRLGKGLTHVRLGQRPKVCTRVGVLGKPASHHRPCKAVKAVHGAAGPRHGHTISHNLGGAFMQQGSFSFNKRPGRNFLCCGGATCGDEGTPSILASAQ